MSTVAIRAEALSKEYRLGAQNSGHVRLGEALARFARAPFRRRPNAPLFAALKDVSFTVERGEVIGLIGRNGAGKSTLLKVLSRITEPTSGRAELVGRLGSLLEVGTGFHGDLTGRENTYLNGAILGMRRAEIDRCFDAIVAFAEIERFIDTPVKHYSSGMYLRLAFAVAAHLETEILLVDEVLAVGDVGFQRKCLGKMGEVARQGRTVLLVSHNMAAIESLSTRCLWLDAGSVRAIGATSEVVGDYMKVDTAGPATARTFDSGRARKSARAIMTSVELRDPSGSPLAGVRMGDSLSVCVGFTSEEGTRPILGMVIKTMTGQAIFGVNNRVVSAPTLDRPIKSGMISATVDRIPLAPGMYFVDLYLGDEYGDHDIAQEAVTFEVLETDVFGTGKLPPPVAGPIVWPARFQIDAAPPPRESAESVMSGTRR